MIVIMKLYVQYDSHCDTRSEGDDADEYGNQRSWSEDWSFNIDHVSTTPPTSSCTFETFEIDADVKCGDIVYLLVLRWSDGDSYGRAHGKGEVLWVFKDRLLAQEALMRWQHACDVHGEWRHDNKQPSATFRVDGGQFIKLGNPAYCYFASVDTISLYPSIVR
jgi:hypothetical protein